jgi:hypothetical protein
VSKHALSPEAGEREDRRAAGRDLSQSRRPAEPCLVDVALASHPPAGLTVREVPSTVPAPSSAWTAT